MGEAARLIEDGCVQVVRHRSPAPLPRVVGRKLPGLEGGQVKMKMLDGRCALTAVPAVGQQHSGHIEEDHVEGKD